MQPRFFTSVPRTLEMMYDYLEEQRLSRNFFKRRLIGWAMEVGSRYKGGPSRITYRLQLVAARLLVLNHWRKGLGGKVRFLGVGAAALRPEIARLLAAAGIVPLAGYGKRLVKAPKVYVRDSGLLHQLASVPNVDTLLGHPLCGPSWEGFVLENVLAQLPSTWRASYYRTSAQAEIDLVLDGPRKQVFAIEIKRTLSPKLSRGYHHGYEDVVATRGMIVIPEGERFPMAKNIEAVPLRQFIGDLPALFE